MNDREQVIKELDTITDTYHSADHPLPVLIELRRSLAIWGYRLSAMVKSDYERKAINYVMRKYQFAREIVTALDKDRLAGKKRPMNQIEAETASLDHVLQKQKDEISAEAQYEDTVARLKAIHWLLGALSQEIADMRAEKSTAHFQNTH